jgi:hypothetical protein
MNLLKEFHRNLIMGHPTFCCPVTKEVLDIKKSWIVEFINPQNNERKIDVISKNGYNAIPEEKKQILKMKIITDFDQV